MSAPRHPLPNPLAAGRPRIGAAPAAEWLEVPQLLLTLASLRLKQAWQRRPAVPLRQRRQLVADWEF